MSQKRCRSWALQVTRSDETETGREKKPWQWETSMSKHVCGIYNIYIDMSTHTMHTCFLLLPFGEFVQNFWNEVIFLHRLVEKYLFDQVMVYTSHLPLVE